jgi:hypothetical protein
VILECTVPRSSTSLGHVVREEELHRRSAAPTAYGFQKWRKWKIDRGIGHMGLKACSFAARSGLGSNVEIASLVEKK